MSTSSTAAGYGAIPTTTTSKSSPQSSSDHVSFFTRARTATNSVISTRRPWRDFFQFSFFTRPHSYAEAMSKIKANLAHFAVNYCMVTLLILFVSLVYHPVSMIVFLVVFIAWFFLLFFRDGPIAVFGRTIDDRIVVSVLGLVTVVALVFTSVGLNVLVSLIIAVVLVGLHASFFVTESVFVDEESAAESGLISVVRSQQLQPTSYSRA